MEEGCRTALTSALTGPTPSRQLGTRHSRCPRAQELRPLPTGLIWPQCFPVVHRIPALGRVLWRQRQRGLPGSHHARPPRPCGRLQQGGKGLPTMLPGSRVGWAPLQRVDTFCWQSLCPVGRGIGAGRSRRWVCHGGQRRAALLWQERPTPVRRGADGARRAAVPPPPPPNPAAPGPPPPTRLVPGIARPRPLRPAPPPSPGPNYTSQRAPRAAASSRESRAPIRPPPRA